MQATRRDLLSGSIGLTVPFLPASVRAARRSLTVAASGGLFQELYEPAILEPFVRTARDLGVFYYAFPSSTQALAALRQQRSQPDIDIVLLDLASARTATDEGLLESLTPPPMPVMGDLAPFATIPAIAGRAIYTEPLVLLYDKAQIEAPPSWKSLWSGLDERSIAIAAPPDPAGVGFTIVAGRLFGGGTEERAAAAGITAIAELSSGVVSWDPRPDVYHLVGDGTAKLGVGWNMPAQVFSDRMGGRLGVAFPSEGTISRVTTVNLVKGSRQPDAARQLIAHMLSAESQKTMAERMFLGPVNARARYAESALQRTANTPDRVRGMMKVDWFTINAIREDIIQTWRVVVPGSG